MDQTTIKILIRSAAIHEGIDANLFEAICTVESSLDPKALRYEPHYRWTTQPREWASKMRLSVETETMLQSCSYGLCQIMGSIMREQGFNGDLQTLLVQPEKILTAGAKHLKKFLTRYGNEEAAIAAYNAGSARKTQGGLFENQRYVDKVYAVLRNLRALT
jgi:soluble lytic murein transglycosylase-like protein